MLLSISEAASYLNIKKSTLGYLRVRGLGPKYVRISSKIVRYKTQDLDEWIRQKTEEPDRASAVEKGG